MKREQTPILPFRESCIVKETLFFGIALPFSLQRLVVGYSELEGRRYLEVVGVHEVEVGTVRDAPDGTLAYDPQRRFRTDRVSEAPRGRSIAGEGVITNRLTYKPWNRRKTRR